MRSRGGRARTAQRFMCENRMPPRRQWNMRTYYSYIHMCTIYARHLHTHSLRELRNTVLDLGEYSAVKYIWNMRRRWRRRRRCIHFVGCWMLYVEFVWESIHARKTSPTRGDATIDHASNRSEFRERRERAINQRAHHRRTNCINMCTCWTGVTAPPRVCVRDSNILTLQRRARAQAATRRRLCDNSIISIKSRGARSRSHAARS